MKRIAVVFSVLVFAALDGGCTLQEVRGKTKGGTEWRHSGSRNDNDERYSFEHGFEFKWDNGWSTGISGRRRDINDGTGDNDTGVWLDVSYPIWKAPKKASAEQRRIAELEKRLAMLEGQGEAPATFASQTSTVHDSGVERRDAAATEVGQSNPQ